MVKRHWGNLGGGGGGGGDSTLGGTGGVVGTGCTMENRAVGLERMATYIEGVVEVALGSVAAAAPQVPVVAAAQAVDDADSDVYIGGAVGKAVPAVGLAVGASAGRAADHDVAAVGRT